MKHRILANLHGQKDGQQQHGPGRDFASGSNSKTVVISFLNKEFEKRILCQMIR